MLRSLIFDDVRAFSFSSMISARATKGWRIAFLLSVRIANVAPLDGSLEKAETMLTLAQRRDGQNETARCESVTTGYYGRTTSVLCIFRKPAQRVKSS